MGEAWDVSTYAAFGHRTYAELVAGVEPTDPALSRRDDTYQLGLTVKRRLTRQVGALVEGNLLHQASTIPGFGYDQARIDALLDSGAAYVDSADVT